MLAPRRAPRLLPVAVLVELRHVGPQIINLVLALDAGEHHLGARHLGARILDVFLEDGLAPGDAGALVGVAVVETGDGASRAAIEPVELRANLVGGIRPDRMTRRALPERLFALGRILGEGRTG